MGKIKGGMPLFWFVILTGLANLALFQKPLLSFALPVADLPHVQGMLQILSLQIVQLCMYAFFMFLLAFFSLRLLKLVAAVLFLVNSAALYFMLSYGIELDRSMIANILNTDTREAGMLWDWGILPYLLLAGVVPAILILITRLRKPRWYWRLLYPVVSLLALAGWLFATSTTWLWYDKHASRMGGKVLPWSYVINTARHFNRLALENREQILLPDATFDPAKPARKQIVVLVIGEAARADNFGLYGYTRDTDPFTEKRGMIALPVGLSCATNTIASTACILTHEGREASSHTVFEPLPSYLKRQGIETFYRTNNTGPPPVKVDHYQHVNQIADACTGADCPKRSSDATLNWKLAEALQQSGSDRIFVTLHQTGSHGPAYWTKYPPEFAYFKPECKTVQIADCTSEELRNAYDNSIRYTDYLLADLIKQLKSIKDADAAIIYVSDHGQSLGEGGFYLHGAPLAIAPPEQRRIPFLVWMSDSFKASRGLTNRDIISAKTYPHDFPFHSVMGAFGMKSDIYKPEFDIFHLKDRKQ